MILTGQCRKDFNEWRFGVKRHNRNDYFHGVNDIVVLSLIEEWFNLNRTYIIPNPILGNKNNYDSFSVIGWRHDILTNLAGDEDDETSYYMGWPIQEWFISNGLEQGETFNDLGIDVFENLRLSKIDAFKKLNERYNDKFGYIKN